MTLAESTADKIGLLPGFGWIADHQWLPTSLAKYEMLVTLLICLIIAPCGVWIMQLVFEFTVPSLKPEDNYKSFLYGDPMLGIMTAILLHLCGKRLPPEPRLYNSAIWHICWLVLMIAIALLLTWLDYKSGQFTVWELLAPGKLYHNLVLYGLYGYLIVVTLIAYIWGNAWSEYDIWSILAFAAAIGWGVWWAVLVCQDSSLATAVKPSASVSNASPSADKKSATTDRA